MAAVCVMTAYPTPTYASSVCSSWRACLMSATERCRQQASAPFFWSVCSGMESMGYGASGQAAVACDICVLQHTCSRLAAATNLQLALEGGNGVDALQELVVMRKHMRRQHLAHHLHDRKQQVSVIASVVLENGMYSDHKSVVSVQHEDQFCATLV